MLDTYKTILILKAQLTSDVYIYRFKLINPPTISFIPGQYLILMVPQENGEKARRLYSIASSNTQTNEFELLVKLIPNGCASCYFEKVQINSECEFQGPAGMFTLRESPREKIALVTGTGYAPIRSMLLSETEKLRNLETKNPNLPVSQSPSFYLFLGFPYYKDVFLFDELKQLEIETKKLRNLETSFPISQFLNFQFHICLSREQNLDMISEENKKYFLLGRVTKGFEQETEKLRNLETKNPNLPVSQSPSFFFSNFDYYLCSGREVVESLKEYLSQKGAPKEQVYFEKF